MRTDLHTPKINTSCFPGLIKGNNSFHPYKNILKIYFCIKVDAFQIWAVCSAKKKKKVTLLPWRWSPWITCNETWDVVSHLNSMGVSESFPHKLHISIMNAGQHFWISNGAMETSFPGTSIKVSLFCLHSPLPLVSPTAVTLSQAVLFFHSSSSEEMPRR